MSPTINKAELIPSIPNSLLIKCREAYPLKVFSNTDTLQDLYATILHNLGQVQKCYNKDEALVDKVEERAATLEKLL